MREHHVSSQIVSKQKKESSYQIASVPFWKFPARNNKSSDTKKPHPEAIDSKTDPNGVTETLLQNKETGARSPIPSHFPFVIY